jgi:hypothetical protein
MCLHDRGRLGRPDLGLVGGGRGDEGENDGGGGEGVGLMRRMELPRLTASMLLLKLARLPHCLC